jgi:dTMP kinase
VSGKIIVIEACDASGKATQTEKLFQRLTEEKYKVLKVEYPNYKSDSSALVKMYLNGEFGDSPEDVNPYVASTFYAGDRFASYKKEWEKFYKEGGIIIADRYTTANMVHQASKINKEEEKEKFLDWLWDFEFVKFGLPIPNCVIFLDMPPEFSQKLMEERKNKFTGETQKDIHEKDIEYLANSYRNSCTVAEKYNWSKVNCVDENHIKSIEEIHQEIYELVKQEINKE